MKTADKNIILVEKEIERKINKYALKFSDQQYWLKYPFGFVDEKGKNIKQRVYRGKRFRPRLLIEICKALQGEEKKAIKAAAVLEIFHNFTLVHDDIIDKDEYRRWRPAVWKAFGKDQAITIGDSMLIVAQLGINDLKLENKKQEKIFRVLNQAFLQVAHGQCLDVDFEKKQAVSVDDYLQMIKAKTASLVATSTEVGAMLATNDWRVIKKAKSFGCYLGMAYQIFDDIVGIWGDYKNTGKKPGGDIIKRKKTLPVILALSNMSKQDQKKINSIYSKKRINKHDAALATRIIDSTGAKAMSVKMAKANLKKALDAINKLSINNKNKEVLENLARKVLKIEIYENI